MLTMERNRFIISTSKVKEAEKMNQTSSHNFIVVLINLISLVIIGRANKAYCGCAGGAR
ncbi:hypothetical protein HMPREF3293_03031 [Christensenella minuta]|uniref:Uncharacterized protein n=1 Tax=Christensenella minuta TaxID=626937 RepID=A0A136Q1K7_9FIRM|nr:hypothetical protein HMPREF3293_03031 [Christensenella minuta]